MDALLTPEEIRKCLKQSRSKVYRLLWTREIKSFCIGKSRRVRESDLNAYIDGLFEKQALIAAENQRTYQYVKKRKDG